MAAQNQDDSESMRGELLALERRLMTPESRSEPASVADLFADGFVEFGSSGRVFDREEALAAMGAVSPNAFQVDDFDVRWSDGAAALVTYRVEVRGSVSRRSSLWVRQAGAWKIVFHQGTPAAAGAEAPLRP